MSGLARFLIILGLFLFGLGVFFKFTPTPNLWCGGLGGSFKWFGHLPGDLYIKKDNFAFYFPLATSIIISLILSLIFYFLRR
ncbi:MAG: hypothetical protein A3K22_05635 [Deltaproteobacteria bacterium RBG_16_42_7]|nr:MAG: hypothetical protein A3K22_05635 [Deltaproteobacteria bacterium RBG_16_42_7]